MYFAFEVDIIAFLDVFRIQIRAQLQQQRRHDCTPDRQSEFGGIRSKRSGSSESAEGERDSFGARY